METPHYLFTYGSLQEAEIQLQLFGRIIKGEKDTLIGYKIAKEKYQGTYPLLFHSKNKNDILKGKVYKLRNTELEKADSYEGPDYKRIKVTLASGNKAWVYVGK